MSTLTPSNFTHTRRVDRTITNDYRVQRNHTAEILIGTGHGYFGANGSSRFYLMSTTTTVAPIPAVIVDTQLIHGPLIQSNHDYKVISICNQYEKVLVSNVISTQK
jgi:hypothetical protein